MDSTTSSDSVRGGRLFGSQFRVAAEEAKIESKSHRPLGTNIASLVRDLARMGDLQLQLLSLDVNQFWSSARAGIIGSLLAATAVLASLPVLLFGLADLLQRATGWTSEACRLTLGGGMTLCGILVIRAGVLRIGNAATCLKRSQEELAQNLKWVREVLHHDE